MIGSNLWKNFKRALEELGRKRTLTGLLNYGVIAFGPEKKDRFLKLTSKSLIEWRGFTFRYIAVVDVMLLTSLAMWALGMKNGFELFIAFALLTIAVFVDEDEFNKRANMVTKTVEKAVEKTTGKG